jgi:hypothetical protein
MMLGRLPSRFLSEAELFKLEMTCWLRIQIVSFGADEGWRADPNNGPVS